MEEDKVQLMRRQKEEEATEQRAGILGLTYLDTREFENIFPLARDLFTNEQMYRAFLAPLQIGDIDTNKPWRIMITSQTPRSVIQKLSKKYQEEGKTLELFLISESAWKNIMRRYDPPKKIIYDDIEIAGEGDSATLDKVSQTLATVASDEVFDYLIDQADRLGASDIHIEPTETNCIVRSRIDGMLSETFIFDKDIYPPMVSRMKLLSNMDIAERRRPQDGRFSAQILDKEYDFRISTLPILNGESIVLRILDKSKVIINLEDLGMHPDNFAKFKKSMKAPYGIILVTGPTGSGKTTTLYGALNDIKSVKTKIITVEDPVEYQLNMIQQVHVNEKAGLTFVSALRSILRQDPDVIMIGEIRDQETLRIAIQAALTGHLVFSTLHTNDAISALPRMIDMGIEPYLVSGALVCIEAQRLVRKLCPHCKQKITLSQKAFDEVKKFVPENYQFYKSVGCPQCSQTGYLGREMISEILPISDHIASMVANGASKDELKSVAYEEGFIDMFHDGVIRAANGITTLEEVYRVAKI